MYRIILDSGHDYAFESANWCENVFNAAGRSVNRSSIMHCINSKVPAKKLGPEEMNILLCNPKLEVKIHEGVMTVAWIAASNIIGGIWRFYK